MDKYHFALNTLVFIFLAVVVLHGFQEILSGRRYDKNKKIKK